MSVTTVIVIDKYGADIALIGKAVRPFGHALLWAENIKEGVKLIKASKPATVLVNEELLGGKELNVLLETIRAHRLPTQLVIISDKPDFEKSMDWVAEGVFSVISSPINIERLRRIINKIADSQVLYETIINTSLQPSSHQGGLSIYKNLAGHLESGPLLEALCDTARQMTGAARVEAWSRLDLDSQVMIASGPTNAHCEKDVTLDLSWKGKCLGALKLIFDDDKAADRLDYNIVDELVWAGSLFLSQSARFEEALKMAFRDPLTGLNNRRVFLEALEREFGQAKRYNTQVTLLTLDIDHFKAINDTYGHQTGDEILKWLSGVIMSVVRTGDLPARIGGEEFAIILPRTSIQQATILAERLKDALAISLIPNCPGILRPTVSQGLADIEHFLVTSPQDLIYWSDQAMYLAKRDGRNTIRTISELQAKSTFQDVEYVFQ
ncbi:MAG: diguanylate cyclase [Deltaproteobacteria bacterium]|nr:diguanylate cyclase [Deltaproteobacteria bacterium]